MGIQLVKKINYILSKRQKISIAILTIMMIFGAFLETFGVSTILPLVNVISDSNTINDKYKIVSELLGITSAKQFIFISTIFIIFVYIIKNAFLIFMYNTQYKFIYNNKRLVSTRMMECYLSQDYLFHVTKNVAELQRNVSLDVDGFFGVLLALIQLGTEGFTLIFLVGYLFMQDVSITLAVMVLMAVFLYVVIVVFRKKLIRLGAKGREVNAEINKWILQSFGGIKDIKVSNTESFFLDNYDYAYKESNKVNRLQNMLTLIPRPIMESVCICGLLGVIAIKVLLNSNPKSMVPIVSVFSVAAIRMLPSFSRITNYVGNMMYSKPSVDALYEDLRSMESIQKQTDIDKNTERIDKLKGDIVARNLSFAYPTNPDKSVLDHVSFLIRENSSVAFVGVSVGGKTTLIDCLLGLLEPQEGSIKVSSFDVYKNRNLWHRSVAYVPQNIYIVNDTVRANVAFGLKKEDVNDEEVWDALKKAQLDDFIREKTLGLDTIIGDRGIDISGGQRQRIGIARALYRKPSVLVLDEATSALDNQTEEHIIETISNLFGKITMIIVAHRLSTIKNCDCIFELTDGRVEQKKYEEIDTSYQH